MDRALLKKSIDDWMQWYEKTSSEMFLRNHSLNIPKKNALALLGVRRCGKSYFAVNLAKIHKDETFYFNFEDPLFYTESNPQNIDDLISVFTEYRQRSPRLLILDEIQNINGWEKWVRKAVDINKYQIILTGSSAKLLSSEISTSIAGRCIEEKIWPLSFSEYLRFSNASPKGTDEYLGHLRKYLQWGGFPEIVLLDSEVEKKQLLRQYLSDLVLKDVINHHQIRLKRNLDQIVIHYFTNISKLHSYTSIKNAYQINVDTVSEYTQYLNDAFLFFEVQRFHPNLKVQSRDPKKVYCIDTGLRNIHTRSVQEELGKLAENMAFIHLKRLGHEITYFQEKGEVDFLITEFGKPVLAIQVCYSNMEEPETQEREINSLVECLKFTRLKKGIILTLSREEHLEVDGVHIQCIPLYRWLLDGQKDALE